MSTEKPKDSGYRSKLGPIPGEHFDNDFPPPDEATKRDPTGEWLDKHVAENTEPPAKPSGAK